MKKKLLCFITGIVIFISLGTGIQVNAESYPARYTTEITVSPRKDIIEWRYKIENNKLYRRQYNCSQSKWIGIWELVL